MSETASELSSRLFAKNKAAIAHFEAQLSTVRDRQHIHRKGISDREGWLIALHIEEQAIETALKALREDYPDV